MIYRLPFLVLLFNLVLTSCSIGNNDEITTVDLDDINLTSCKWKIDSLKLGEALLFDNKDSSSNQVYLSSLYVTELYDNMDKTPYFEFKKDGRVFLSFVDLIMKEQVIANYTNIHDQITFNFRSPPSLDVLSIDVEFGLYIKDENIPVMILNDSDYMIYFLSCVE